MFPDLKNVKTLALDLETYDPNLRCNGPGAVRKDGYVLGVAVATGTEAWYFPLNHRGGFNYVESDVYGWLRETLPTVGEVITANGIYDLEWLAVFGVRVSSPVRDVQIAEALIDENRPGGYSLDSLAGAYVGAQKGTGDLRAAAEAHGLVLRASQDPRTILHQLPSTTVSEYAKQDALLTLRVWEAQQKGLTDQELWRVFELETALTPLFLEMRLQGVRVDLEAAHRLTADLKRTELHLRSVLKDLVGEEINEWSARSIAKAFDAMRVEYPRTDLGSPSFRSPWLQGHSHPLPRVVYDIRRLTKLRRDFVERNIINKSINGRLHCVFHQVASDEGGTKTGRLASSKPNLQNVPIRDPDLGPKIRALFIPEEGQQFAKLDYSQQEPRLTVHYACLLGLDGAEEARKRYTEDPDTDYHQRMADMTGLPRSKAKSVKLGRSYGMGVAKFAEMYGFPRDEAEAIFKQYDTAVPYEQQLMKACATRAKVHGYVKTVLGRRARFNMWEPSDALSSRLNGEEITPLTLNKAQEKWPGKLLQRAYTYKAVNRVIQGSAADQTKLAMLAVWQETGLVPHLQVHDELDVSVPDRETAMEAKRLMENCLPLRVPSKVDLLLGKNWGDAQ